MERRNTPMRNTAVMTQSLISNLASTVNSATSSAGHHRNHPNRLRPPTTTRPTSLLAPPSKRSKIKEKVVSFRVLEHGLFDITRRIESREVLFDSQVTHQDNWKENNIRSELVSIMKTILPKIKGKLFEPMLFSLCQYVIFMAGLYPLVICRLFNVPHEGRMSSTFSMIVHYKNNWNLTINLKEPCKRSPPDYIPSHFSLDEFWLSRFDKKLWEMMGDLHQKRWC